MEDNICKNHLERCKGTVVFADFYKNYCLWPGHSKGVSNVVKPLYDVEFEDVHDLLKFKGKLLLYGGKACTTCAKTHQTHQTIDSLLKEIAKEKEKLAREEAAQRNLAGG